MLKTSNPIFFDLQSTTLRMALKAFLAGSGDAFKFDLVKEGILPPTCLENKSGKNKNIRPRQILNMLN